MPIVKLESVQFTTLLSVKGKSRTTSQITAAEARQWEMTMTMIDGHTLRLESPLAVQLVPSDAQAPRLGTLYFQGPT
jgi:hypothetical protein